jgi:hypothetical protein
MGRDPLRRRGLVVEAQGMQIADLMTAVSQELGLMQRPSKRTTGALNPSRWH